LRNDFTSASHTATVDINNQTQTMDGHNFVELDALVVGAGFGGIYQLKKFRDMGFAVKAIDTASDVGG
jgi:cation diffusion facilitator CzcD-associated flavoprotein CzcO